MSDIALSKKMVRQKNLWVSSGSDSLPKNGTESWTRAISNPTAK